MRPTCLNFRSPKERTPDPYDITITCTGSSIKSPNKRTPSFSRDKRFKQYEYEAKKTGYLIGPGSYLFSSIPRIKGGVRYKPFHIKKNPNELIYVGQSLLIMNPDNACSTPEPFLTRNKEIRSTSASSAHYSSVKQLRSRKSIFSENRPGAAFFEGFRNE